MPINLAHEKFIQEMILHGDRLKAYKAAYPNASDKTAIVNASRLMARPEIAYRINGAILAAQEEVETELKKDFKDKLLEVMQKRHLLYRIAMGQLTTTKYVVRYKKMITWQQKPGHHEILSALRLDTILTDNWKRNLGDGSDET